MYKTLTAGQVAALYKEIDMLAAEEVGKLRSVLNSVTKVLEEVTAEKEALAQRNRDLAETLHNTQAILRILSSWGMQ